MLERVLGISVLLILLALITSSLVKYNIEQEGFKTRKIIQQTIKNYSCPCNIERKD
jgi:hypothetical protein